MRGRRPKERKSYVLRTKEGTVVEVNREIYLEQAYLATRLLKNMGGCLI